jgi:apolipoprotein N-acyltransferase
VAIAATSGISAVVAPDRTRRRDTHQFTPAVIVEEIAQRESTTPATRLGQAPEWALTALGAGALVAAVVRGRRR